MRVWSYCAADWTQATRQAGGVEPITAPPTDAGTLDLTDATRADLVYLNLHGYADQPHYYGQAGGIVGPTALTAEHVRRYDWRGVVVFAEVCFSALEGGGPIAQAFLERGARAFVGSLTEAYGRVRFSFWDGEADRLMWLFRRFYLGRGGDPARALHYAKLLLRIYSTPLDAMDKATLTSFVCLENKNA